MSREEVSRDGRGECRRGLVDWLTGRYAVGRQGIGACETMLADETAAVTKRCGLYFPEGKVSASGACETAPLRRAV